MKRLLIAGLLISSSALSCENSNPSPWGEIIGAFGGAWAGNQLGGSGLPTIIGAIVGGSAGGYYEDQVFCQQQAPRQDPACMRVQYIDGIYDPVRAREACWASTKKLDTIH